MLNQVEGSGTGEEGPGVGLGVEGVSGEMTGGASPIGRPSPPPCPPPEDPPSPPASPISMIGMSAGTERGASCGASAASSKPSSGASRAGMSSAISCCSAPTPLAWGGMRRLRVTSGRFVAGGPAESSIATRPIAFLTLVRKIPAALSPGEHAANMASASLAAYCQDATTAARSEGTWYSATPIKSSAARNPTAHAFLRESAGVTRSTVRLRLCGDSTRTISHSFSAFAN